MDSQSIDFVNKGIIIALILAAIMIFTILGNILVIWAIFTYRPLHNVQNMFLVSLAVSDITVAVFVMPFNVAYNLLGKWIFGLHMCEMWLTSDVLCCTASILNLCAIAMDRYWAIHDPINYAHKRTMKRVLTTIALVWAISALISIPPLIGWNDWPAEFDDNTPCKLSEEKTYLIYSSSGSFFIPLIIMTVVYFKIFKATSKRLRDRAKASAMSNLVSNNAKNNTTKIEIESASDEKTHDKSKQQKVEEKNSSIKCKEQKNASEQQKQEQNVSELGSISQLNTSSQPNIDHISLVIQHSEIADQSQQLLRHQQSQRKDSALCDDEHDDHRDNRVSKIKCIEETNISSVKRFWEEKQKISLSRERRATRILGIVMGVFVACWLPFFLMYVIMPFCEKCYLPKEIENFITWLGYINSALNPLIYCGFNRDFRKAFQKIICCRKVI